MINGMASQRIRWSLFALQAFNNDQTVIKPNVLAQLVEIRKLHGCTDALDEMSGLVM